MFTGIIEEIGKIGSIRRTSDAFEMVIEAEQILKDVNLGDSISVNGVCLTVTSFTNKMFSVDIMPETVHSTSLKDLKVGSNANLELAMVANGRFGGHFVSGHVDGVGEIINKVPKHNAVYYNIMVPDELARYLVHKGSIAVDGTSLTIFEVGDNVFTISLIPHTMKETVLGSKNRGDIVNIECDMLVKYMERLINKTENRASKNKSSFSASFLEENGFK
jgi:riboflavin synthase